MIEADDDEGRIKINGERWINDGGEIVAVWERGRTNFGVPKPTGREREGEKRRGASLMEDKMRGLDFHLDNDATMTTYAHTHPQLKGAAEEIGATSSYLRHIIVLRQGTGKQTVFLDCTIASLAALITTIAPATNQSHIRSNSNGVWRQCLLLRGGVLLRR